MKNTISFKTKIGWLSVVEKDNEIFSISFNKTKNSGNLSNLLKLRKNINNYLEKKTKILNPKILFQGTKLQIRIWKELKKIPYGRTKSYGEIAKIVKTSPRYVGNVCGQNKHLIVIPCHRVIRTDGGLGGFSAKGGISLKKRLLELEES
tara:strand:- start:37 stop:483 length:447 start_codon:yes stop_codon:yes gene_type:complete